VTDIVCTLTDDDARGRFDEYARLLAAACSGRERTAAGMRWFLRSEPGVAEWARDLAARENACCAFLDVVVSESGDRLVWDMSTSEDPIAQAVVDVFYELAA